MGRSFTADSDRLQTIIDEFEAQAQVASALHTRLSNRLTALAPTAEPVRAALETDILPRLAKLRDGLAQASTALANFLTDMSAMQPALDALIARLPEIERAREKVTARLAVLAGQGEDTDPDELLKRLHTMVNSQGSKDENDSST